jgi:hypothetical protein
VDFDKDRGLFRTFVKPFEASCKDTEPTLQLELVYLNCSNGSRSKFNVGLPNFCKCRRKANNLICGLRQLFVHTCSESITFINKLSH